MFKLFIPKDVHTPKLVRKDHKKAKLDFINYNRLGRIYVCQALNITRRLFISFKLSVYKSTGKTAD